MLGADHVTVPFFPPVNKNIWGCEFPTPLPPCYDYYIFILFHFIFIPGCYSAVQQQIHPSAVDLSFQAIQYLLVNSSNNIELC